MTDNGIAKFVDLIRDMIKEEIDKTDSTVVCKVVNKVHYGAYEDRYDLNVEPDENNVIKNIQNASGSELFVGDYVYVYKIDNKLNNCFIFKKIGENTSSSYISILQDKISTLVTKDDFATSITQTAEEISLRATHKELESEISQKASEIYAQVVKKNDSNTSTGFGWSITVEDGFVVYHLVEGNRQNIIQADANGLTITGKVEATSGYIGNGDPTQSGSGFHIGGTAIYNGISSFNPGSVPSTGGIYLGTDGIQLGENFRVDRLGNVTALTLRTILSTELGYYLSETMVDPTLIPESDWSSTFPSSIPEGYYLYTRRKTTYSTYVSGTSQHEIDYTYNVSRNGADGTSVEIKGNVANWHSLPAATTVSPGDGYIVDDASDDPEIGSKEDQGILYTSTGTAWTYCGQIRGPAGSDGQNAVNYSLNITSVSHSGSTQQTGITIQSKKKVGVTGNVVTDDDAPYIRYKWGDGTLSSYIDISSGYTFATTFFANHTEDLIIIAYHRTGDSPNYNYIEYATQGISYYPQNTPSLRLTSTNASISYNGNTKLGSDVSTTAELYLNDEKITTGYFYKWTATNCTISPATSTTQNYTSITVTGIDNNQESGYVICEVSKGSTAGTTLYSQKFSVTKQQKGGTGASAWSYWIVSTSDVHTGARQTSSITLTPKRQQGNGDIETDTDATIIYYINGVPFPASTTGSVTIPTNLIQSTTNDILVYSSHSSTIVASYTITYSPVDTPILLLTQENASINYDGATKTGNNVSVTAKLYLNGLRVTSGYGCSWSPASGSTYTGSVSTDELSYDTITVTSLSVNSVTLTCTVTNSSYASETYSKNLTVSKQLKGDTGTTGQTTKIGVQYAYWYSNDYNETPIGPPSGNMSWWNTTTAQKSTWYKSLSTSFPESTSTTFVVIYKSFRTGTYLVDDASTVITPDSSHEGQLTWSAWSGYEYEKGYYTQEQIDTLKIANKLFGRGQGVYYTVKEQATYTIDDVSTTYYPGDLITDTTVKQIVNKYIKIEGFNPDNFKLYIDAEYIRANWVQAGTLTANTGKIAGFNIEPGVLSYGTEGQSNSIYLTSSKLQCYVSNNRETTVASMAIAKFIVHGMKTFTIYYKSNADSSQNMNDYIMVSTLLDDSASYPTVYSDQTVAVHTRGNSTPHRDDLESYNKYTFNITDDRENAFYVVFRKDSTDESGDEWGRILLPEEYIVPSGSSTGGKVSYIEYIATPYTYTMVPDTLGDLDHASIRLGSKFYVDSEGQLNAIDGNFQGTINSTSGNIGGFTIQERELTSGVAGQSDYINLKCSPDYIAFKSSNQTVSNSYSVARITIKEAMDSFTVYIRSNAEERFDYTIASVVNASRYPTSKNDVDSSSVSLVKAYTAESSSGTSLSDYTEVVYNNLSVNDIIYIVFKKDASEDDNDDSGYFLVSGQLYDLQKIIIEKYPSQSATEAYIRSSATPLYASWLSLTEDGPALTPVNGGLYKIKTSGGYYNKIYEWDSSMNRYKGSTDAYIVSGSTARTQTWLSLTSGGSPLTPTSNALYHVVTDNTEYTNKVYKWSSVSSLYITGLGTGGYTYTYEFNPDSEYDIGQPGLTVGSFHVDRTGNVNGGTITLGAAFSVDSSGNLTTQNTINADMISCNGIGSENGAFKIITLPIESLSTSTTQVYFTGTLNGVPSTRTVYFTCKWTTERYSRYTNYILTVKAYSDSEHQTTTTVPELTTIEGSVRYGGSRGLPSYLIVTVTLAAGASMGSSGGTISNDVAVLGPTDFDTYRTYTIYPHYGMALNGDFIPSTNATSLLGYDLGWSTKKWRNIYSLNGVTTTSDKREKKDINYNLDKYDNFFNGIKPANFKLIDGSSGRIHIGFIAQDIRDDLVASNLLSTDFGGYIRSLKPESENKVPSELTEDDYIYGLRYEEFIGLLVDQVQKLKARVIELENKEVKGD